jgi:phosphoglycolate phosphatase
MASRYPLIVFDWDGTLVDSAAHIVGAMQDAITTMGLPSRSAGEVRHIIGLGLIEAIAQLYPDGEMASHQILADHYKANFLSGRYRSALFPGVELLLASLQRQGYRLAVATGKSRRGLERALDEFGLRSYFAATRCADETVSKPHPQMLHELIDEMGVSPGDVLMVGDTEFDLQMAINAGVDAVAVSCGAHPVEHLENFAPKVILDAVDQLEFWLKT